MTSLDRKEVMEMKILWIIFIECLIRPIAKLIGVIGALLYIMWCNVYKYRGAEKTFIKKRIMKDVQILRMKIYEKLGIVS